MTVVTTDPIETTATTTGDESVSQEIEVEDESSRPENPSLPANLGTDLPVGRVPVGVAPLSVVPAAEEIRALASLAVIMAHSQVGVAKSLRDKPNDVLAVFLTARGLGVDIMTALRTFHVIEGQVSLSPKIRLAMAQEIGRERGWKIWPDPANSKTKAVWHAQRPETPGVTFSSEYSWEDAQEAEMASWDCEPGKHSADCRKYWPWVNNKPTRPDGLCKENYRKYPARMLSWRAAGYLLDDRFPEVGQGLYSPDELGAITDDEGNPIIDVASVEVPAGMTGSDGRVSGAPPAPDPPGVAKASEELRNEVKARIVALPDPAKELLRAWWVVPKSNGTARSGVDKMTVADSIAVQAYILGLERRAAASEWGAPGSGPLAPLPDDPEFDVDPPSTPVEQEKPLEAAETFVEGSEAVSVPDLDPAAVAVVQENPGSVAIADVPAGPTAADFKAQVDAMDNETVAEYLTTLGLPTTGRIQALRGRLEVALIQEAVEAKWAAERDAEDLGS